MRKPTTAPAVPANGEVTPTIADVSYRNYDGPLITHALRWWVVAWATIRQSFSKSKVGYWIIAAFVAIGYLARGVFFYFGTVANKATGMNLLGEENVYASTIFGAQSAAEILLFAAALTVGAASIAADNRANALLVYLSKPLTRLDYLIGKWMGIFLLLLALVLLPNLLMYLFFLGTFTDEGFLKENPYLFVQMLVASVVSPAIYASLMLWFSAWSKSPRIAGAIFAAFYFILSFATEGIAKVVASRDAENTNGRTVTLIRNASVDRVGPSVASNLYNITPQQALTNDRLGRPRGMSARARERERARLARDQARLQEKLKELERPPMAPVALLAGLFIVLPLGAAAAKVRAVEVIKG